jgi:peptide deformylase
MHAKLVSLLKAPFAALALVEESNPTLRSPAQEWDHRTCTPHDALALAHAMGEVMVANGGIGLAAPQVGISTRLFVMRHDSTFKACFNPRILTYGGEVETRKEGCLSFPGLFLDVGRHTAITVEYQDAWGNTVNEELAGIPARCYQHEMDHLDGVCIVNHASKLALNIAQRKRNKIQKRKS